MAEAIRGEPSYRLSVFACGAQPYVFNNQLLQVYPPSYNIHSLRGDPAASEKLPTSIMIEYGVYF